MAHIEFVDVGHAYQPERADTRTSFLTASKKTQASSVVPWALAPMTMTWSDGGAYALLGPSGCGKTTLLNIISGLITPTRGRVLFDGRDVTSLTPEARNIAQVFQFPVVYDTMSVFDNLAFPLRNRRWSQSDVTRRVHEIAEILELSPDLGKRARAMSADQKQKISLGRGLVRPDVAAVLFDEPLTVIDPHLKWLLRRKLKQIHQQLKVSLIYVTHDQTEALTFADQVIVMTRGEIVQVGMAEELFAAPAHRFVGHFIGSPGMNFVDCTWANGVAHIADAEVAIGSTSRPQSDARLAIGIRPEHVELTHHRSDNCIPASIEAVHDEGMHVLVGLRVNGAQVWAKQREPPRLAHAPLFVHFPARHCALYADDRRLA